MRTVTDLTVAAAQLSPTELRDLHREILRLERQSRTLSLDVRGLRCQLVRLADSEFLDLRQRSIAIQSDTGFELRLFLSLRETRQDLNFAQVYLALKSLSGESSRYFDEWKGSFSFPFSLDILKDGCVLSYLLEVRTKRDSLYFDVRKVVAVDDARLPKHLIHPPFADEFSREKMNQFTVYLYGFLIGLWKSLGRQPLEPFVRKVPSDLILFGCCNGETFEEQYDSEAAYTAALHRYEQQVELERTGRPQPDSCVVRSARHDS